MDGTSSSPSGPPAPPLCGKRLLHDLIDERGRNGHERPFASIPRPSKLEDGYMDVSYRVLANSINRLAHWIVREIGEPCKECEPIMYIAPLDLRYQIFMVAAVKAGYIACLPSPRNSESNFTALLESSGATKLLTSSPPSPAVSTILKAASNQMQIFTIPMLQELLDENPVPHVAIDATWDSYRHRPFVQIHSSGSTGTPKLVTLKHGSFTALDAFQLLESNELGERFGNLRVFVTVPPFHIAGITYTLASPVWVDSTVVLPPTSPLTADLVNTVHQRAGVQCTLLPPSIVVDLGKEPAYFQNLIKLSRVVFTGGPLPESTGEKVAKYTRLYAGYGATEWNAVPQLTKDREDWAYFRFNEREGGLEFRTQDNGLYEMVICRRNEFEFAQPVFVTFPDINEFASKDLFVKHPTKPGLWKFASRLDDIIVLSNGEKLNPVTFEGLVSQSPDVKGCLVVGHGQFQPSLLIEPVEVEAGTNESELVDKIWPFVQQANEGADGHGKIARDCVFFTGEGKPLPRAGKGTIQRDLANDLYASEIESLYSRLQGVAEKTDSVMTQSAAVIDLKSVDATLATLREFITSEIGLEGASDSDDFFVLGMDSLQVVNIVRAINNARPEDPVDAKQVYDNPSIMQLARSLHSHQRLDQSRRHRLPFRRHAHLPEDDSDDEELKESWLAMEQMYGELTARMKPQNTGHRRKRALNGWLQSKEPILPPDGGRIAWLQVLAMALVNFNNFGLVNSFGVFQAYYETDLVSDYSPSSIAIIGTLEGALLLIVGAVSGPLFDKGYFKSTLVVASLGLVFALMMLSLCTQYYQVLLTQGILLGVCSGFLYIPSIALVPVYFKRRRGLALGLATGGGSLGGVIYPVVFRRLLVEVGFPWAVRVLGFIALLTLGTAVALSKPIGVRIKRNVFEASAFREGAYVAFLVSAFVLFAAVFVPYFLVTSYSIQELHASPSPSFYLISLTNAAQFFGRLLPAWAADYHHANFGPETFQLLAELVMGILGFAWVGVRTSSGFAAWLVFYGFFSGMPATLPAVVLPYICPNLAVYGTRMGMLYACAGVGVLVSTPIAGAWNSRSGGFLGSQLWTGACCLVGSLLFVVTALECRKRRLQYELGKRQRRGTRSQKGKAIT